MTFLLNALVVVGAGSLALMPYVWLSEDSWDSRIENLRGHHFERLAHHARQARQTKSSSSTTAWDRLGAGSGNLEDGKMGKREVKRFWEPHIGYVGYLWHQGAPSCYDPCHFQFTCVGKARGVTSVTLTGRHMTLQSKNVKDRFAWVRCDFSSRLFADSEYQEAEKLLGFVQMLQVSVDSKNQTSSQSSGAVRFLLWDLIFWIWNIATWCDMWHSSL